MIVLLGAPSVMIESLMMEVNDDRLLERVTAASGSSEFGLLSEALRDDPRVEVFSAPMLVTTLDEPASLTVQGPAIGALTFHARVSGATWGLAVLAQATVDQGRDEVILWIDQVVEDGSLVVVSEDRTVLVLRARLVPDDADHYDVADPTVWEQRFADLRPAARRRLVDRVLDDVARTASVR